MKLKIQSFALCGRVQYEGERRDIGVLVGAPIFSSHPIGFDYPVTIGLAYSCLLRKDASIDEEKVARVPFNLMFNLISEEKETDSFLFEYGATIGPSRFLVINGPINIPVENEGQYIVRVCLSSFNARQDAINYHINFDPAVVEVNQED